jgi:ribonuclease HI
MRSVEVWCDGSGTVRGNPGGWGVVLVDVETGVIRELSGGILDATNNIAELTAAIKGINALRMPCRVAVYSDSEYVVNAFRHDWFKAWERKKWAKVKNVELWHELLRATQRHDISFHHVDGHSGVELNERCDKMAGACRRAIVEAQANGTIHELKFTIEGLVGQLELA